MEEINSNEFNNLNRYWYAVYTIVRHEKAVDTALREKEVETFLPLREVISQWKDRKRRVQFPLFPGYMFVHANIEDRLSILKTPGIVRLLGASGKPLPVPDEQVEAIRKLLESKLPFDPYPYFRKGKKVIVINGPLQGVTGIILERRGLSRLILSVDLIKRAVSVEIDNENVELI